MEKLHRASNGSAVTLSGERGIILRSSAKIPHKVIGADGKPQIIEADSFSYHPSVSAEKVTLVWSNDKNLVIIDRSIADFLLLRKWAAEVPDSVIEWWNSKIDEATPSPEPKDPPVPATPTPAAVPKAETPAPAPAPTPEPPKETPKVDAPKEAPKEEPKEAPKPAATKPEPAALKPAATKEEALKRAEEEAKKLAGDGAKKPVTD